MAKRRLSRRQLAVIGDLFAGDFSEQQVLDKHDVSRDLYNKWLSCGLFVAEFERRIAAAQLYSRALIARYSLIAATKLVALTESKNAETARKACLDIINLPAAGRDAKQNPQDEPALPAEPAEISPDLAERLLAALAEQRNSKSRGDE